MLNRVNIITALFVLLIISKTGLAGPKLTFGVNAPGSPPYLYLAENGIEYLGVIPDILAKLEELHGYKIRYIDSFRKRTETFLYQGDIDGFLSSKQWLEFPHKLIFSRPVASHRSYFYSNQPFTNLRAITDVTGVNICTRRGYIYPTLTAHFSNGSLKRVDSSSQLSMLNMLRIDRCNMAIMHEFNALAILSSSDFKADVIYQSPFAVDLVDLSIILRPQLREVKHLLDKIITDMKMSGDLEKSLRQHIELAL